MNEEWKVISGTNGKYQISNFGNAIGASGKKLKPTEMKIGYLSIAISYGKGKVVRHYIHKLVAEYFLGNIPNDYVVNHKDHNKHNNHFSNLEIISRKDNASHWAGPKRSTQAGRKRSGFCGRGHKLKGDRVYCLECRNLKVSGFKHAPPKDKEWRDSIVPGYLISSDGAVWSKKTSRFIKSAINKPGYSYVNLRIDGKTKNYSIHRLVVEAFIKEIPEGMVVDHINSNKNDNRYKNLRIVDRQSNSLASRQKMRDDGHHGFSINERQAGEIKWLLNNTDMFQREIAQLYGITQSPVSAIKNGRQWAHANPIKPKITANKQRQSDA